MAEKTSFSSKPAATETEVAESPKVQAPAPAAAPISVASEQSSADAFAVTLHEFCSRLSATDKRVELISAFYYVENKAGVVKDSEANFKSRFDAFCNKPV